MNKFICPECGKRVSDESVPCPKCGFLIREFMALKTANEQGKTMDIQDLPQPQVTSIISLTKSLDDFLLFYDKQRNLIAKFDRRMERIGGEIATIRFDMARIKLYYKYCSGILHGNRFNLNVYGETAIKIGNLCMGLTSKMTMFSADLAKKADYLFR